MRSISRMPMIISAVLCAISALAGLLIFTHTYANTPTVHQMLVRGGQYESKALYLLSPELLLIFFSLWTAYFALTWKRFVVKGTNVQENFILRFPTMRRLNVLLLFVVVCFLICAFSAFHLWDLISRSKDVWAQV